MRKFSSYGPVDVDLHFYAPRTELIHSIYNRLLGEVPEKKGGHYITIWAPRQTGKTWVMQQVMHQLRRLEGVDVVKLNVEHLKQETQLNKILHSLSRLLLRELKLEGSPVEEVDAFQELFSQASLNKPLILIIDEFDALDENAISVIVGAFRNIYVQQQDESHLSTQEKSYFLHAVALIGVRSVLGVDNVKGSPFNVQRSVKIPNLTEEEIDHLFLDYEKESGQKVEEKVVRQLWKELRGQPGLTCWFGELLTEAFNLQKNDPITLEFYQKEILPKAMDVLPNNNILNLISKAKQEPHKGLVLELFQTQELIPFRYEDPGCNFLYMNGIIDLASIHGLNVIRFSSPFVQKRLFHYFSHEIFRYVGKIYGQLEDISDAITDDSLNIHNLLRRYEIYLRKNREWLLKNVPRREDLRIYEAVFHFNFYQFLSQFLRQEKTAQVIPEFPTGNGKIDLVIRYAEKIYGIELKSFTNFRKHTEAIQQAANYGKQLGIGEITLACFVEEADEESRKKIEQITVDQETQVKVNTVLVVTGS